MRACTLCRRPQRHRRRDVYTLPEFPQGEVDNRRGHRPHHRSPRRHRRHGARRARRRRRRRTPRAPTSCTACSSASSSCRGWSRRRTASPARLTTRRRQPDAGASGPRHPSFAVPRFRQGRPGRQSRSTSVTPRSPCPPPRSGEVDLGADAPSRVAGGVVDDLLDAPDRRQRRRLVDDDESKERAAPPVRISSCSSK